MNSSSLSPSPVSPMSKQPNMAFTSGSKQPDIGIETILLLPLLALIGGGVYSALTFFANFDPILAGPVALVFLVIIYPAKFIAKKKRIKNYSKLIVVAMLSVLLAFIGRFSMEGYLSFQDFMKNETQYLQEENAYVSEKETENVVNAYLVEQTGYSGYLGAFMWDLQNTVIKGNNSYDREQTIGFGGGVGINAVELLVALLYVFFVLPAEVKKIGVLCEQCGQWKKAKTYLFGNFKNFSMFQKIIASKDFMVIRSNLKPEEAKRNDFTSLLIYQCDNCFKADSSSAEIDVIGHKNQQRKASPKRFVYTSEELKQLFQIIQV